MSTTKTANTAVQLKATLPPQVFDVWKGFEHKHLGVSKSSLFRMLLVDYARLSKSKTPDKEEEQT